MNTLRPRSRCAIHWNSDNPFVSVETGRNPALVAALAYEFQFAMFIGESIANIAALSSITLFAKPLNNPSGSTVLNKTIPSKEFYKPLTFDEWNAGSLYHFAVALTDAETAITPGTYDLTLMGFTNERIPIGKSTLTIEDRGVAALTTPSVPASHPTTAEMQAFVASLNLNQLPPGVTITLTSRSGLKSVQIGCSEEGTVEHINSNDL